MICQKIFLQLSSNVHLLFDYPKGKLSPCFIITFFSFLFFFPRSGNVEQSPNKSPVVSPPVVKDMLYKGERATRVPSSPIKAKWPAWGHASGCSRAHPHPVTPCLPGWEVLFNLYIQQAQTSRKVALPRPPSAIPLWKYSVDLQEKFPLTNVKLSRTSCFFWFLERDYTDIFVPWCHHLVSLKTSPVFHMGWVLWKPYATGLKQVLCTASLRESEDLCRTVILGPYEHQTR